MGKPFNSRFFNIPEYGESPNHRCFNDENEFDLYAKHLSDRLGNIALVERSPTDSNRLIVCMSTRMWTKVYFKTNKCEKHAPNMLHLSVK